MPGEFTVFAFYILCIKVSPIVTTWIIWELTTILMICSWKSVSIFISMFVGFIGRVVVVILERILVIIIHFPTSFRWMSWRVAKLTNFSILRVLCLFYIIKILALYLHPYILHTITFFYLSCSISLNARGCCTSYTLLTGNF